MTPSDTATNPTKASAGINLSQSADPRRVLADRVEQLYSQMPIAIGATIVAGAFATWELQGRYLTGLVLIWGAIVFAYTGAATALLIAYRRSEDKIGKAEQWLRSLGIAALANGASWGLAGAVFFRSLTEEQQVFLAFLFAGISSIGIPVYAASWPIFAIYAAGILLPFTYVLATIGSRLFLDIAVLVPVLYLVYVGIAYRLHQVFDSGYRLRHAYGKLTVDYTALNQRLEQQLVETEEARRQVEASGRKLALFAERSPIAVFEFDASGNVLSVNPAAENLFGFTATEMTGRPGIEFMFPGELETEVASRWREFIKERTPVFGLRYNNIRRDGSEVTCEWNLTPLVNPDNRVVSVIIQGRDITQQLEAERMKQEFTSTLSHELRTPLTSIIGSLQLINSGVMGEIEKDTLELTTIAERNGQRLLDLINDILDVEKIESGKLTLVPEVLELGELIAESLALNQGYAERFKVKLAATGVLNHVKVTGDRKRVHQIMTNLLSNAVKFTPEGSVVAVTVEHAAGNLLRVAVHDSGPGIPEDFRSRIFGRFAQADMSHTRQKGGTGLGLSICKRLVELMGGKIGFLDREGGGSTFWFELPKHD